MNLSVSSAIVLAEWDAAIEIKSARNGLILGRAAVGLRGLVSKLLE